MEAAQAPASTARDPRVARAAALLRDAGARHAHRAVALDGEDLIAAALDEGLAVEQVLAAPDAVAPWRARLPGVPIAPAGADALRALGALGQPARVVAVCRLPEPPSLGLPPGAIVLAGVRDAGNVGSILRSAAAFRVPRVWLAGACADPWSRRALRAAMGASLRPGLTGIAGDLAALARLEHRPPLAAAVPRGGTAPEALPAEAVVVLGDERDGLTAAERAACELAVTVPADGFESLNVAAAAAVLLWARGRAGRIGSYS